MRSRLVLLCASSLVAVFSIAYGATADPSVQGLGLLPGGTIGYAFGVSGDGSVVVGSGDGTGGGVTSWTLSDHPKSGHS